MSTESSCMNSSIIGISFGSMNTAKRKIDMAQEAAKAEMDSLSRAISSLQVYDDRLRMKADALDSLRRRIADRVSNLQGLSEHIEYVVRRFEETDNLCAQRFKTDSYKCRKTLGLAKGDGIFGNLVSGIVSVIDKGESAWDSIAKSVSDWFKKDKVQSVNTGIASTGSGIVDLGYKMNNYYSMGVSNKSGNAGKSTESYDQYIFYAGESKGPTITSGTLDPITQAAVKEAQALLDKMLDKYYPYEWPEGYSIGNYTLSAEYKTRYQNAVDKAKDVASFFDTLDLASTIKDSYGQASEASGGNPAATLVGTIVFTVMNKMWNEEPGIGNLPDALGISSALNKSIAKALEKSQFIDSSNYKYLVYSGQFLWEEGPRGKFIDNITSLENEINNNSYSIYGTSAENNAYKQALIGYLGTIKNMNENYDQSVSDMNFFLNRIGDKYK